MAVLPCISRPARTIVAPNAWPIDWWPRQTPSSGHLAGKPLGTRQRNARLVGRARAGRNDQVRGGEFVDFLGRDLVVAIHLDVQRGVDLAEPLHQVVGERVVVVDEQDHASPSKSGSRAARRLRMGRPAFVQFSRIGAKRPYEERSDSGRCDAERAAPNAPGYPGRGCLRGAGTSSGLTVAQLLVMGAWSGHCLASSRTLNSSFQRLSVCVLTHQSSKTPNSVRREWNFTGT